MNSLCYIEYNFVVYSFVGWIIEQLYSYSLVNHFKREGFLYGPIKPMYGIAMTSIICLFKIYDIGIAKKMAICLFIPMAVEYTSGYLLKKLFNEQYWSYANQKINLSGLVCLKFCIYWVILIMIALKTIVPVTDYIFNKYNFIIMLLSLTMIIISIVDFSYTLRSYVY